MSFDPPEVSFAAADDGVRIAYSVFGSGPTTVIVPPLVSNVELVWEHVYFRRVLEHLGAHLRVVMLDKRGIGLSDRFDETPTAEQRVGDITAVMDAEGIESANLMGVSEGGTMALLFAARHPERVDRVVASNAEAPQRYRDRVVDVGSGRHVTDEDRAVRVQRIIDGWGWQPGVPIEDFLPSLVGDEEFVRWQARFERQSATRGGIRRQLDSLLSFDLGDDAEAIRAPTLVTHTLGDRVYDVGHARVLAEIIPGARLEVFEGDDHFFWLAPYWRTIVDRHIEFVTGRPVGESARRVFAAVLFTDLVGSTAASAAAGDVAWRDRLDRHDDAASQAVARHGGEVLKSTGDGVLAVFPTASAAVGAAAELRDAVAALGLEIRAGIHAGEIERRGDDVSGLAVNLAARVEQSAEAGQVYVTSTVREMLLGGSHEFESAGSYRLKGFDEPWTLHRLGGATPPSLRSAAGDEE